MHQSLSLRSQLALAMISAAGAAIADSPKRAEEIAKGIQRALDVLSLTVGDSAPSPCSTPTSPIAGCTCASGSCAHDSSCAVHNEPALPAGPCDCPGSGRNTFTVDGAGVGLAGAYMKGGVMRLRLNPIADVARDLGFAPHQTALQANLPLIAAAQKYQQACDLVRDLQAQTSKTNHLMAKLQSELRSAQDAKEEATEALHTAASAGVSIPGGARIAAQCGITASVMQSMQSARGQSNQ
ncbi:hypothetical protein [Delftia sp. UGAL515B_04]|uniref:hypothetical protein n=1 Tax=Delftia sp. UGAL515B_04 TaxID=2986766 RepID=UPI0029554E52|nr:hypothetical protein [Delftia sp. UGAL515B_04]WON88972.1 hypothetical protein OK021_30355 [Delftia sp. UGAL515B_04]